MVATTELIHLEKKENRHPKSYVWATAIDATRLTLTSSTEVSYPEAGKANPDLRNKRED